MLSHIAEMSAGTCQARSLQFIYVSLPVPLLCIFTVALFLPAGRNVAQSHLEHVPAILSTMEVLKDHTNDPKSSFLSQMSNAPPNSFVVEEIVSVLDPLQHTNTIGGSHICKVHHHPVQIIGPSFVVNGMWPRHVGWHQIGWHIWCPWSWSEASGLGL